MDRELVVRRVRAEFLEMPGLTLTVTEATRLWGLERHECEAVISALVDASFLRWTRRGVARADN